jgi:hypothetical protein
MTSKRESKYENQVKKLELILSRIPQCLDQQIVWVLYGVTVRPSSYLPLIKKYSTYLTNLIGLEY